MSETTLALTPTELAQILGGEASASAQSGPKIRTVAIHSRSIHHGAAFFALEGKKDGHEFVTDALAHGASLAVVRSDYATHNPDQPLLRVPDPLAALQNLAAWWRSRFSNPVVAITGSNGKSTVKECLHHILYWKDRKAFQSPGSFNSQSGVPLSLVRLPLDASIALLEVGISQPGEMDRLRRITNPTHGILTNIGWAHLAEFGSPDVLLKEKLQLFCDIPTEGWALLPHELADSDLVRENISCRIIRFGEDSSREVPYAESRKHFRDQIILEMVFPCGKRSSIGVRTPSLEVANSIEIAIAAAYLLDIPVSQIEDVLAEYIPIATRTEKWKSPSGITLISDTSSGDLLSLRASLSLLSSEAKLDRRKFFVLNELPESDSANKAICNRIGQMVAEEGVDGLLLVGDGLEEVEASFKEFTRHQNPVVDHITNLKQIKALLASRLRAGDAVLVTGPQQNSIDRIATDVIGPMAPNRFFLELAAVQENVAQFRHLVGAETKIMAIVKAQAYGTDAIRLAQELKEFGVDAIGVSSADEGVALREGGLSALDILVLFCSPDEAEKIVRFDLTPVIHSREVLDPIILAAESEGKTVNVHLEAETGMGRSGVLPAQFIELARRAKQSNLINVVGLMTHFGCADNPDKDDLTRKQIQRFEEVRHRLREEGFTDLICHASATAGTVRFPEARYDMVRIGIGLFGIYPSDAVKAGLTLVPAVSLVSRIIRIQEHQRGDEIGYGGLFTVPEDGYRIAIAPHGYHDALPWNASNKATVHIRGQEARILGRVSMDSFMIDVSHIPAAVAGDDVLLYGEYGESSRRPEELAAQAGTIAYELMARMGPRVQRIFIGS